MSVMLTLISTRPIFFSSGSSEVWMFCRNCSRWRLMSSMRIEAITCRIWPKMMCSACCLTSWVSRPSRRMAAFCISSRLGADGHREDAGHVDADVLDGQGALERDLDLDRLQVEEGVVLDQRHDEGRAAVDALRGVALAHLAEDHQDAVARAAFVLLEHHHDEEQEYRRHGGDQQGRPEVGRRLIDPEQHGFKHEWHSRRRWQG